MNYGGDAADQIVRYSLDGVDHGLRLSGTLAKHLAVFVAAVLKDQKKTRGRARMVRILCSVSGTWPDTAATARRLSS